MKSLYLNIFNKISSTHHVDLNHQYESETIQAPVVYFCTFKTEFFISMLRKSRNRDDTQLYYLKNLNKNAQ